MNVRISYLACALILSMALSQATARAWAETNEFREGKIRAAALFHIARYTNWPPPSESSPKQTSSFRLCVVGDDMATPFIEETVSGKTLDDLPISLKAYPNKRLRRPRSCRFNPVMPYALRRNVDLSRVKSVLRMVESLPILTVSSTVEIIPMGGICQLIKEENRLRIKLNPSAIKRSRLILSSELMDIALLSDPSK